MNVLQVIWDVVERVWRTADVGTHLTAQKPVKVPSYFELKV